MTNTPILAALTHPLHGAGAIGSALMERVSDELGGRVWIVDGVDPTDLLGIWADSPIVVIIEAKRDGAIPGTVRRYDLTHASVSVAASRSVGIAEVLAVARALDQAPQQTILITVTVAAVAVDLESAAVLNALDSAAALVRSEFAPLAKAVPTVRPAQSN